MPTPPPLPVDEPRMPTPPPSPRDQPTPELGTPVPPRLPAPPRHAGIPWETDAGGWLDRLVETTRRILTAPTAFFQAMPTSGGLGRPLTYGLILGSIGAWVGLVYQSVFREAVSSWLPSVRARYDTFLPMAGDLLGTVLSALVTPAFIALGIFICAGVVHLMLMLFGAAPRGYEGTLRATAYALAPSILTLVPFCGDIVARVWTLLLVIIGVSEAHNTSKGVAAAAVLLPILLACLACCGLGFVIAMAVPGILEGLGR